MNAYISQLPALDASTSLAERAYRSLREKILYGDIAPGAKLKMETLQRDSGLSSSPLREALSRLAAEGLVLIDENRGFRCAPISVEDFEDITALRQIVEPAAFADSIKLGDDEWESRVVGAFHRLKRSEGRLPPPKDYFDDDWTARHKDFHMALYSACASRRLYTLCWNLFDQAERYRRYSGKNRRRPRDTGAEHRALMEFAVSRDTEKAMPFIRKHMERTYDHVRELFST